MSVALKASIGATLESVTFVRDYVQLQFNAAHLTAYTSPQVEAAGGRWTSQDIGWCDSLCARIGVAAKSASCSDPGLQFDFVDGSAIAVSLRDEDYHDPEAFMLSVRNHDVVVS